MRSAWSVAVALAAAGLLAGCTTAAPPPPGPSPDSRLEQRLVAETGAPGTIPHLEALQRLADENGGNRASPGPGYDASVDYLAGVLRDAGYEVSTPTYPVSAFQVDQLQLTVAGSEVAARAVEFSPATPPEGVSASLSVLTPDRGAGCDAADFTGVAAGSAVLLQRGRCSFSRKTRLAAEAGAAAVLFVNDPGRPPAMFDAENGGPLPAVGLTAAEGAALAAQPGAPVTLRLAGEIRRIEVRNLIAQTRTGSRERVVMAGAHLDSVAAGPGINDNGTGAAALLEIAQRLGGSPAVGNAVRFAWWGSEEAALDGSTHYVETLSRDDRERIALYLNLDMLASPNAGYFVQGGRGSGSGPDGSAVVARAVADRLAATGVEAEIIGFDGSSDYDAFVQAGIPSGGVLSGDAEQKTAEQAARWGGRAGKPFDPCYHQACDRFDTLDRTALDRFTDAVAGTLAHFALSTDDLAR
ncbi:M28 family peptidase [Pseudonocardia bannensis]|uniref:M28 family peptidase n=1 Tax=Pseudonocardia bannensis TaxID=630973 RepID=A0A848DNN5_9PSEU|nr:M28 family peptidase [Pseudonocardia bannensis]NMH94362.1 M28 family peptidase [Pseudonocardia bannensis]